MPHGRNKRPNNNKKKKKQRNQEPQQGASSTASSSQQPQLQAPSNRQDFPVFNTNGQRKLDQPVDSVYLRYKEATQNFESGLRKLVPEDVFDGKGVNWFTHAADYIADNFESVDKSLMDDLKLAIRVRKRVATSIYCGGDGGHSHFIAVLSYCWVTLLPLERKKARREYKTVDPNDEIENRFAALEVEDDDDDDETDLPHEKVARPPTIDETSHRSLTVEELKRAEDRTDAIIFLMTLDDCMRCVADQFSKLRQSYLKRKRLNYPQDTIVEQLIEASTAVNLSIQQVSTLEQELSAQYPHLNTVYRLFAVLVLSEFTHDLSQIVRENSPRADSFREADAIAFLGDAVECGFRNPSDPKNKINKLDKEFCQAWKIEESLLQSKLITAKSIASLSSLQAMVTKGERAKKSSMMAIIGATQAWLPNSEFIGGTGRTIIHTIKLLQSLSNVLEKGRPLLPTKGFFGDMWDESHPSKNITYDMDELLMAEILPHLFAMSDSSLLSTELPFENELLPLFVHLRDFYNNPEQVVSWSLSFGVHALLTSICEAQGSGCIRELGQISEHAFQHYISQIKTCIDRSDALATSKYWEHNLKMTYRIQWLVAPALKGPGAPPTERALWNPLCSGAFLGYIAFFVNLDAGTTMIDSFAQLRIVLHLYNAFLRHGLVSPGELPILDILQSKFGTCKAVWEGLLPSQGEFVKRFWIAYGTNVKDAARHSEETRKHWREPRNQRSTPTSKGDRARNMVRIKAEELSKSYSRICLHNSTGVVDKYHTAQQKTDSQRTIFYEHAVFLNDTLDWIEEDQTLLAMNLISTGEILNQFVNSLCNVLEWRPFVDRIVREMPAETRAGRRTDFRRVAANSWEAGDENLERQVFVRLFADRVLGALDFHPDPLEVSIINTSVSFMQMFFSNINPKSIMWFTPIEEEEEEEEEE